MINECVHGIIRLERLLVKALHLLETISARLAKDDGRRVELRGSAGSVKIADPTLAAMEALAAPIDYPPLVESIVPGDRVAIALDAAVPQALAIVRGAVTVLTGAGVDPEAISVVVASSELTERFRAELHDNEVGRVRLVLHDPDDEANLCFVGLAKHGQPLVVNRAIHEADMVLPIGLARPGAGAFGCLYPQMSSAAVIDQFRTPATVQSAADRKVHRQQIREAGWLIGVAMAVQIVPAPNGEVAHVLAGEPMAVSRRATELYRDFWSRRSARPAGLVIATVTGGPLEQSWQNVGQALAAANRLLEEERGAVALCTNLDQPVGESLGRLVGTADLSRTTRKLFHEHAEDSWAAWQLARALSRGPVYFMSQLDAETVEELGLAPIADIDELVRLASRQESFVVLEDAQHVLATVEETDVDE